MNSVLEKWKNTASNTVRARIASQPEKTVDEITPAISPAVLSLARQIFCAGNAVKRRRVLFVAADAETKVARLGEEVARAVAGMQVTVALVDSRIPQFPQPAVKKPVASVRGSDCWSGFQISERLWKIPCATFLEIDHPLTRNGSDFSTVFDCVVFTSAISDSSTSLFCSFCDAAVLLISSGQTRRDVALRAKQVLEQFDVELLGTVLVDRTFPIPESIYRRL